MLLRPSPIEVAGIHVRATTLGSVHVMMDGDYTYLGPENIDDLIVWLLYYKHWREKIVNWG